MERADYDAAQTSAQAEPDALQPVERADMHRIAELLKRMPVVWKAANPAERKTLFRAMLERVYVRGIDLVAIQPRSELERAVGSYVCCLERTRRDSNPRSRP